MTTPAPYTTTAAVNAYLGLTDDNAVSDQDVAQAIEDTDELVGGIADLTTGRAIVVEALLPWQCDLLAAAVADQVAYRIEMGDQFFTSYQPGVNASGPGWSRTGRIGSYAPAGLRKLARASIYSPYGQNASPTPWQGFNPVTLQDIGWRTA